MPRKLLTMSADMVGWLPGSSPTGAFAHADRKPYSQRLIVNRPWNKCGIVFDYFDDLFTLGCTED